MYSRRAVLSAGAMALLTYPGLALAQQEADTIATEIQRWMDDNKGEGYFDPAEQPGPQKGSLILGPNTDEVRSAAVFLATVPVKGTPLSVAKWMIDHQDQGKAMEWPPDTDRKKPANPIIIAFFAATRTKPTQGDQTAWCAAFMNWVLNRVGMQGTASAGSASFRNYGQKVDQPSPGDIACFVNTSDPTFGHVSFFDGWVDSKRFYSVGGNQRNALDRIPFSIEGGGLKLHSFRRMSGLQA